MRQSIAFVSAIAGLTFAQSSNQTINMVFPGGYEGPDPVASVVSANPSTTILDLSCPSGTSSEDCGFGQGFRYSIISTTAYQASIVDEDAFTISFSCDHNTQAEQLTCAVSVGGDDVSSGTDFGDAGTTTSVLSGTDIASFSATVTAGAELLSASGVAQSGSAQPSGSSAASSPGSRTLTASPSGTAAAGSQASSTGASATGTAAPQHTGAAYRFGVEGSALLALAGAAALNAL
jgi:hypothetical protein